MKEKRKRRRDLFSSSHFRDGKNKNEKLKKYI